MVLQNMQKTGSKGGGIKVNSTDTLKVVYATDQDIPSGPPQPYS